MGDNFKKIVKVIGNTMKAAILPMLPWILIVVIVIVAFAGIEYIVTLDTGTKKEDDWSNTPFGASNYTNNVNVNTDGSISTQMTAQEVWDELIENGSNIKQYLDSPEQLQKLMNAQLVTQYPDTRPDTTKEIDWENMDEDNLQGVVKFIRADSSGNRKNMTYADPQTFQSYIDDYNSTGSEQARENALSHFTIETKTVAKPADDQNDETDNNTSNNDTNISTDELFWPTDFTDITSAYGNREGGFHNGIDIKTYTGDDEIGNPVYACEEGTVKYARWSNSAGWWVVIDHGNGFTSEYMHNSSLKIAEGEKVQKGQLIAISGNTGDSQGVHLHFEINKDEKSIDPLSFKYSNGQGNGTGGFGNFSIAVSDDDNNSNSEDTTTEAYVKVATWTETQNIENYEDPELEDKDQTYYNMTTQDIAYQNMTEGYTMPFEFLWALLVVGNDKDFVLALADLVYGSDIEITIHDNLRIDTKEEVYTYEKNLDVKTSVDITTKYKEKDKDEEESYSKSMEVEGAFLEGKYKATLTEITRTNTLDVQLTRANVWIVDYKREYQFDGTKKDTQVPDGVERLEYDNDEEVDLTDNEDKIGAVEIVKGVIETELKQKYDIESIGDSTVNSIESKYYEKINNLLKTVTNTTETSKYTSSPATITEKTDKEGKNGENFVTLFNNNKYLKNQGNILSAPGWLFEILERNDSTKDMVDLMKYLLYKATGENYGVTEYDFSIFDLQEFTSLGSDFELLRAYIRSYEGTVKSDDGTKYIVHNDGAGNPTVGYGVLIDSNVKQILESNGFSTQIGAEISDMELVDSIEEQELRDKYNEVRNKVSGLNLKEYQIYALVSRAYNCGTTGALDNDNGIFVELYKQYWNEETDDQFEEKNNKANFSHPLYVQFMSSPTKVKDESGQYVLMEGLVTRRESEWTLFQTGYFDNLDMWYQEKANYSVDSIDAAGYRFPHYLQKDFPGSYGSSTIPKAGCGPTSLAMIIAGLRNDASITPYTLVEDIKEEWPDGSYYLSGQGSSHCIFSSSFIKKYYGLNVETCTTESKALEALENGYPVLGGEPGHFLALIPAPDEYKSQGYKFYVLDSARGHDGPYKSAADFTSRTGAQYLRFNVLIKP